MTKPTMLKFRLITRELPPKLFMETMNKLNEKEWMGKEPRSCKIKDIKQKQPVAMGDYAEFDIFVEHKPKGCITFDKGGFWYDGWTLRHIDVMKDGTLLDGSGKPLPAGADPVFLSWRVFEETDFNNYDFGKLLGEEEREGSEGL